MPGPGHEGEGNHGSFGIKVLIFGGHLGRATV